jgi:outer membrane protein assembly factor BamA
MRDFLFSSRTSLGQPIGEEGNRAFFSERQWGVLVSAAYPFHTFRRVSLEVGFVDQERIRYTDESREFGEELEEIDSSRSRLLTPRLHHTFDNTLSGLSGPIQGTRYFLSLQHAVAIGGDPLSYTTAMADLRRYFPFNRQYVLALRGMAAASLGPDPQVFQLGGPNTIRGFPLQEFRGPNAALFSIEFRYPFLEYVRFGWPFRSGFGGVRGNIFVDLGTAFEDWSRFRFFDVSGEGNRALEDLKVGFGMGFRVRVAFLPVRVDVGWPTDLARAGSPTWHFSIGPEY